jgi:hypothetical protein
VQCSTVQLLQPLLPRSFLQCSQTYRAKQAPPLLLVFVDATD